MPVNRIGPPHVWLSVSGGHGLTAMPAPATTRRPRVPPAAAPARAARPLPRSWRSPPPCSPAAAALRCRRRRRRTTTSASSAEETTENSSAAGETSESESSEDPDDRGDLGRLLLRPRRGHFAPGTYEITLTNEGGATHDLVVERDGEDVAQSEQIEPGESSTFEVTLEEGEYVFYCSVGNHRVDGHGGSGAGHDMTTRRRPAGAAGVRPAALGSPHRRRRAAGSRWAGSTWTCGSTATGTSTSSARRSCSTPSPAFGLAALLLVTPRRFLPWVAAPGRAVLASARSAR